MGLAGPKAKSAAEQKRAGDPGKRVKKLEAQEAEARKKAAEAITQGSLDTLLPVKPVHRFTKEAGEHWDFLVPQLVKARVIRAVDVDTLGDYCVAMGYAIEYERYIIKHGAFVQKTSSTRTARPEVEQARKYRAEAAALRDKLGLTPKARLAMGITIDAPPAAAQSEHERKAEEIFQAPERKPPVRN